ncbi:MAG: uncharacterized protein PWP39_983 [Pyrococcus sp.]|nr:uncharacterized protein [Pyrococcus sp.]
MMWEIIKTIYREVHFSMIKENPSIMNDPKKLKSSLKHSANIKWGVFLQSISYLFFGLMIAISILYSEDELQKAIFFSSYLIIPFILTLYSTALATAYLLSSKAVEPLKPLPLRNLNFIVSLTLLVENLPALVFLIPASLALGNPIASLLGILWIFSAILMGHSLALFLQIKFSGVHVGKRSVIKTLAKVTGFLLIAGIYFVIQALMRVLEKNIEIIAPIFRKYFVAFPFAASTVYEPSKSLVLLAVYTFPFLALYFYDLKKLGEVLGGIKTYGRVTTKYELTVTNPIIAIFRKDYRIVFRKNPYLGTFLSPLLMSIYFIYNLAKEGFPAMMTLFSIMGISVLGLVMLDPAFAMDREAFAFLSSLPIKRREYLLGKMLTVSLSPLTFSTILVLLSYAFNGIEALFLIPFLASPFLYSSIGILYVKHKMKDDRIELPVFKFYDGIVILALSIVPFVIVAIPIFLLGIPKGYLVSGAVVLLGALILSKLI